MADLDLTALRAKAEAAKALDLGRQVPIHVLDLSGLFALLDRVEKAEADVKTLEDEMACFEEEERMADEQSEMDRRRLREQDNEIDRLRSLLARAGEALHSAFVMRVSNHPEWELIARAVSHEIEETLR